nr:basic proline-rich protein [Macaca nemestrina]
MNEGAGESPDDIPSFKNIRQNPPRRARKNGGDRCRRGDGVSPLPGSPTRCFLDRLVGRQLPGRPNAKPAARHPPAPTLPGPPLRPQQPPAPGLPAGPRRGHRGRTEARGFSSSRPPPRPRPLPGRRDLQSKEGLGPFRAPRIFAARPSQSLGQRRDGGAARGPLTHLRARAATPGGQRHPEPPQPLLPPPPEAPLRKRDHWSEAATLPDMVPPSSPPTSPFPHAGLPSRGNWGAEVRLPGSNARQEVAPR